MRRLHRSLLAVATVTAMTVFPAIKQAHAFCVYNRTTYKWLNHEVHLGPIGVEDARKQHFLADRYFQAFIYYGDSNGRCCPSGSGQCRGATVTTRGNDQPLLGPEIANWCSTPVAPDGWVEITASQAVPGGPVTLYCIAHAPVELRR